MTVQFLARWTRDVASSRIRAWHVVEAWNHPDVVCAKLRDSLRYLSGIRPDVLVLQKPKMKILSLEVLEALKSQVGWLICDFCDPDWCLASDGYFRRFAELMSAFVVSNRGLQAGLEEDWGIKSTVIEDRMPAPKAQKEHATVPVPTLVWYGQFANREICLASAALALKRLHVNRVPFRLRIIDNGGGPQSTSRDLGMAELIEYRNWSLDRFETDLLECDVALLPPHPGRWGTMKSNNKQLTAAWLGLPTTDGQDYEGLKRLLTDAEYRDRSGRRARMWAEREGHIDQSVQQWKDLTGWAP